MNSDTLLLTSGVIVVVLTIAAFWYLWPQDGASHALLKSRAEPFIMVALTTGLVLGAGMFFAGLVPG